MEHNYKLGSTKGSQSFGAARELKVTYVANIIFLLDNAGLQG